MIKTNHARKTQLQTIVFIAVLLILTGFSQLALGQTVGDYRSAAATGWSTLSTWQRCNSLSPAVWATPTAGQGYPGQFAGTGQVTIQNNVILQVNPASSIGALVIQANLTPDNNNRNLTISGDFSISAGTLTLANNSNNSTYNIGGNFTMTGGTITETSSGATSSFVFNKSGTQSFTKTAGTISQLINFTVNSGAILDMGTSVLNGSVGAFTLSSGSGIITKHVQGISTSAGTGCIQVTGTKTYSTGADYTYNGTAVQVTGNGLPVNVDNLSISNSSGVNLSNSTTINGTFDLQQGALAINGNTLTINGALSRTGAGTGTITGSATSNLSITGSGAFDDFYFTTANENLFNLTVNRVGTNINLSSNLTIAGTFTLTNGVIVATGKTINLTNSASASVSAGIGSYIDGSFSRAMINAGGTYVFPVGSSSCNGAHWLTFSSVSGTTPTMKVTYACSGAMNGDATIANPLPININWHIERVSGTFTDATVKLEGNEIDFTNTIAQSALQAGTYSKKTSIPAIGSVTAANIGAIATDKWLAIGSSTVKTFYSYQSGLWNTSSTWTLDPSGTTQVGSSLPSNDDFVVILPGRTVTLPANIATTGLDISIQEGGFLDLSTYQYTAGLDALSGQGTLRIAASYFPTVTTNNFVNAGGGTTEYRANVNLPSQAIYNNLSINASGLVVTQTIDLLLNGNLYVKSGTFRINDNTSRRLKLTVNGDVTVDAGTFITVGSGVTNSTTVPLNIVGGTAPFLNYYDLQSHRIVLNGNFTNNGTVRFTNLAYPIFNAFPPTTSGATTGFATVYFQGASDNTLLCAGPTDFYNMVLDKGIDQTFKLTVYTSGSVYSNFRLFGANVAGGDGGGANPNLKKALWIRTGTLVLEGMTMIPSLTEGNASEGGANPNSDFYIPANGALVLNGTDVVVLSTADDYREVNLAYNTAAPGNAAMGITAGGPGCALSLFGKLQLNNGYLSTRESGGIITSSVSAGQFIMNNGTVDAKQFLGSTGAASFEQNGGLFILRGRFQRTPAAYSSVANLVDVSVTTLNTARLTSGINSAFGSFNLENTTNIFTMSGGTIRIYDVCDAAAQEAFDIKCLTANINVTGGTLEILPTSGTGLADAVNCLINSTAPLGNLTINRASGSSGIQLSINPLYLLGNLTLMAGTFDANNLNVTIGGNVNLENGTTYTPGTNTTILNGITAQTFTVNLATALSLNNLTIDKPAGSAVNFAGSQKTINVGGDFRLALGTLNDNGNTINVYNDVFNSGIHAGTGKIAFIGTVSQAIDGNGIFNNIELNNNTAVAAPVSLIAKTTITGALTFSRDKLFNIGTYNLLLNASASIVNGGSLRYIQTSGNSGDGGLTKVYSSTVAFIFPIGGSSTRHTTTPVYSPATIGFSSVPSTYGSVTVIPVGYEHPASTVNGQSLTYFWHVQSNGFTGIQANSVSHTFVYDQSDVVGTEINYIPSVYNQSTYTWNNGVAANINTITNTITDWAAPTNSKGFLDGDYTAGDAAFGIPKVYYSRANSNWNVNSTWSTDQVLKHTGVAATSFPGLNDIVIIGNGNTVSLAANAFCASLQIASGAVLDIKTFTGSNFGMVLSHSSGNNGKIRVTAPSSNLSVFTFPAGDFSDFDINKGTTEFYTTSNNGNYVYILPSKAVFGNMILSPLGGDNLALPNVSSLTIYGDLSLNGTTEYSGTGISWNTNNSYYGYSTLYTTVEKTVHILGNMNVNGGTFCFMDDLYPQHLIVDNDVNVASTQGANIWLMDPSLGITPNCGGGSMNNTFTIGGNLNNNGGSYYGGVFNGVRLNIGTHYVNVTFFGANNASITGTGNTAFRNVTINKGISQSTTLTCSNGGTLTTPVDNWLTLQNGTFRYMRPNPGTDFTVSTTTPFTIPATAGLYVDYSNTGNKNILIANNNIVNTNDVFLNGKLTLVNGNVYVGPTAAPNNNNDIEYSGGGSSEIEIQGGSLIVNGQIRQHISTTSGILRYNQSGGAVTINGNAANTLNAKLEVLNSGSDFTMSGGTLTIVRGGGSTYGDLYLRPGTGSVTGGDIIFAHNLSGINQQYLLDATIPLNNLRITGRTVATAASATVKLMINPLVLNGSLLLTNALSILDVNPVYNLPVTIKGDFTNNGAYNHYKNLTTFNGDVQSLLGSTVSDFYDLTMNPVTKLTLSKDITVLHDLTLSNGTLECITYDVNVKGNFANNATYTNTNAASGVVLNGVSQQHLSGTGTFGQLELNNAFGSTLENSITLNNNLLLTNGIFDINKYLLTLGMNSSVLNNGTPFGLTKMITSDGVWRNVGIVKVFGSPLTTTFTYPLGIAGKYTPATFNITANGSVGSIRINNINRRHPAVLDPANVLKYYWEVESIGVSGFSGKLVLNYKQADVVGGPESNYIAAQLLTPATNWSKAASGAATDNVDETIHTITFNYNNSSNLTGEYTAGNDIAIPTDVPQYTSNADGNWTDNSIWTPSGGTSYPCPIGGPNGFIVTVNNEVTANSSYCFAYKTTINGKLKAVAPFYGHNFGTVSGNGILYLENAVFPAGGYTSFLDCSGNGTLEYGGTGTYDINATLYSALPRMFISGTGTRVLPDKDLTICKQLKIDDSGLGSLTLDNSINNRRLTIEGTFERYNNGTFNSGTGTTAVVEFAGSSSQIIGGSLGDFTGINAFNDFEINNNAGLSVNNNGSVEINGNLLLTNGLISTTSTNKLTITNYSVSCVIPDGGSVSSYIDGPLIKMLNQGDPLFKFPIGKKDYGLGNKLSLRATKTGTLLWTVEYFSPNIYPTFAAPLTAVNTKEYWNVSGVPATSQAYVNLAWDNSSDLTPLMTQNGMSDMRVAEYNGTDWNKITSGTTSGSDNYNGSVETSSRTGITSGSRNYTLGCENTPKPRIRLTPAGPICGNAGIPVTLTSSFTLFAPYSISYTKDGIAQTPLTPAAFPATIPTAAAGGVYKITGFTYNYPSGTPQTGVFDATTVTVYAVPSIAAAGPDQSLCGVTTATLAANTPSTGTGSWSIISGSGGTVVAPSLPGSVFNGTNGSTYILRWTITNGTCTSTDDVTVSFPLLAAQPLNFSVSTPTVCQGATGVAYTVPNDPSVTYNWSYSGTGATIIGTTNAVTINFNAASTSGNLSVSATNSCNTSLPRSIAITITPNVSTPVFTLGATSTRCQGAGSVTYTATAANNTGITYSLDAASLTGGNSIVAATGAVTYVAGWSGTSTITSSAAGCNGPKTATHTVTVTPTVGTAVFALGTTSTRCQGAGSVTYTATATNNTGITYTLDAASVTGGNSIVATTGAVTYVAGWSGTSTITSSAAGCNGPKTATHTVTVTPIVGTPVFTLGATSTRCQGAGSVTYTATATNNTGITYTLDAASVTGGNSIIAGTGVVTYSGTWSGTSTISASAAGCNGPKTATHTVTITPTVSTPVFFLGATSTRCKGAGTVTYTATSTNSTGITYSLDAASITGGNSIVVATGLVTYVAGWSGTSIITARATGCNGPSSAIHTVTIIGDEVWAGSLSTNWNTAGNWSCSFVPDLTTNVQIPNVANKPVLSSGAIGAANNIIIASGSSLTVSGNTLQVAGTITNNGTFTATAGIIEMKGTSAQTIGAGVFAGNIINGLTINNPAGVTLQGPLSVTGIVYTQNGNLISTDTLTLISTVTQTALIDGTGTGAITGNVSMQRYLPSGYGYKYLSSPFTGATVKELADDIDLAASFPNLYQYDEDNHRDSLGVSIYTTGWSKYITITDPLIPMKGYAANMGNLIAAKTVVMTGLVNNNILTTQTLYNHNRLYTQGFNLVGNPYPSPIDWNASNGWTKTNVDNALYFFDNGTTDPYTGTYSSYINGVSTGMAGNIIPSMQGFFIHVSNGAFPVTAALGMDNRVRVNTLSPAFHKSEFVQIQPMVRLAATYGNLKTADPAVVYFDDFATTGFDQLLDALKLMNTDLTVPNLYFVTPQADKLSISAMPFPTDSVTKIPFSLKTEQANMVTIKASDITNIPLGYKIYLSDEATGKIQNLQFNPEYRVHLDKGTSENRFELIFSTKELVDTFRDSNTFSANIENGKLKVYVKLNPATETRLAVSNVLGQVMMQKELFGNGLHEIDPQLPAGIYILTLFSQQGVCSHKIYIPK